MNVLLLKEMISVIVSEELTPLEEDFSPPEEETSLNPFAGRQKKKPGLNTGDMAPEDFEKFLRVLVKRKYGRATLQRGDMEKLDKLTRWMQAIPGGHQYRRGLAKYLRSKQDKVKRDPFRDFRQYRYDNMQESIDSFLKELDDPESLEEAERQLEDKFFHGTTVELNPGDLVLPPEKTNNMSEKGRKKNLNKVFLTRDFGSAKIYAGRAFHSLGGTPVVYQVEPQGPLETINDTPGTTVFTVESARVIKKIPLSS